MVNLVRDCPAVVPIPGVVVPILSRVGLCNAVSSGSHGGLVSDANRKGDSYIFTRPIKYGSKNLSGAWEDQ